MPSKSDANPQRRLTERRRTVALPTAATIDGPLPCTNGFQNPLAVQKPYG